MKKIVVGVDGSKESRKAVAEAAEFAQAFGAQLILVYVVEVPLQFGLEPAYVERAYFDEREHGQKLIDDLSAELRKRNIAVEGVVSSGNPAEMLASMTAARDIDLVVVGHRGRNAVARALLGSVADRLVQISEKPVLVSR